MVVTSPPTPSTAPSSTPNTSSLAARPLKIRSSWIASISYRRVDGVGFLAVFTKAGHALVYGPSPVAPEGIPQWTADLVMAGARRSKREGKEGGRERSMGRAFNRLVRKRAGVEGWGYQRVEGEKKLRELKEMME